MKIWLIIQSKSFGNRRFIHLLTFITELTSNEMETLREEFYADDKNRFALNVVSRSDPLEACLSRLALETTNHVFNHKVDEVKPVTSQKSSGRCWIFAVL